MFCNDFLFQCYILSTLFINMTVWNDKMTKTCSAIFQQLKINIWSKPPTKLGPERVKVSLLLLCLFYILFIGCFSQPQFLLSVCTWLKSEEHLLSIIFAALLKEEECILSIFPVCGYMDEITRTSTSYYLVYCWNQKNIYFQLHCWN